MQVGDIRKAIVTHLTAKCLKHEEKLLEICPIPNCTHRLLCRVCKKEHPPEHLPETYYLKEIFEDGHGIFTNLKNINEKNEKIVGWLRQEIAVMMDDFRSRVEEELMKLEEKIFNELKESLTLSTHALDLQQNFVNFLASPPGYEGPDTDNFIMSYHKYVFELQGKAIGDDKSLYPKVVVNEEFNGNIIPMILNLFKNNMPFYKVQMIDEVASEKEARSKYSHVTYELRLRNEMRQELEEFKKGIMREQTEEMMNELKLTTKNFKHQLEETEKMYQEKLELAGSELHELKNLWQYHHDTSEDKYRKMKTEYEHLLRNMKLHYEEQLSKFENARSLGYTPGLESTVIEELENRIKVLEIENNVLMSKLLLIQKENPKH